MDRSGLVCSWIPLSHPVALISSAIFRRPYQLDNSGGGTPPAQQLRTAAAHGVPGVPDVYSEKPAGKAYPGCNAISSDQFEVELWIAVRTCFPWRTHWVAATTATTISCSGTGSTLSARCSSCPAIRGLLLLPFSRGLIRILLAP